MAGQWTGLLEGALAWAAALPGPLANEVAVDVPGRRVRLSHARVETLSRQLLRGVRALELRSWASGPAVYDLRLTVRGWKLRVETTPVRLELAEGRYTLWLATPGRVEPEESPGASSLLSSDPASRPRPIVRDRPDSRLDSASPMSSIFTMRPTVP